MATELPFEIATGKARGRLKLPKSIFDSLLYLIQARSAHLEDLRLAVSSLNSLELTFGGLNEIV